MGTVLAMKRLILLLVLAACAAPEPIADPRTFLTRAQLDQTDDPLMLGIIASNDAFFSLNPLATNGEVTTWRAPDDITFSFRNGVLVATRGLGQDMMTADMEATLNALRRPPAGLYQRFQGTLDGQSSIDYRAFQCRVTVRASEAVTIIERTVATTRTEETCISPGVEVTNIYWRGADGVMWKSRQWVGSDIGYLETERLVR